MSQKLPGWVKRQPKLPPGMRQALNHEIDIKLRNGPREVRGPREIDITYTMGEEPGAERDPVVVAAIRRFDRDFIPLWGRYTYVIQNDTGTPSMVTFGRHVIARYIANPKTPLQPFTVQRVEGLIGPSPNQIEMIWDGRIFNQHDPRGRELPGDYLPFDWRLYHFMQAAWNFKQNNTPTELKQKLIWGPQEALRARQMRSRQNQRELNAMLQKDVNKLLSRVSELEMKEYFSGGKFNGKPPKALVDMGVRVVPAPIVGGR